MTASTPLALLLLSLALVALVAASSSQFVHTEAAEADRVTSLPLIKEAITGQFSGYLQVDTDLEYHYWLVEAETNPANAPVVLWLNGGPGCSSLDGYWYEHGPFHFAPAGPKNELTVIKNPYSWNKVANIIYLETPPGVGFSYSHTTLNTTYNDPAVAKLNYQAIKQFFVKFPALKANEFWITGESYAGVYVPMASQALMNGIKTGDSDIKFKGIMVGNGVTNPAGLNFVNAEIDFLHGHGIISDSFYQSVVEACPNPAAPSGHCNNLAQQAFAQMDDIDMYDIYGDCYHQRGSSGAGIPCISSFFGHEYLNMPETKKAIHVKDDLTWAICNFEINENYARTQDSMVPIYKDLLAQNLEVLIYSGDVDFSVPFTGTQYWVYYDMNLTPNAGRDWAQWYFNDDAGKQVAGMVTDFQTPKGKFTFATVRGSGHMVPQFKPIPALVMFEKFLSGQPL